MAYCGDMASGKSIWRDGFWNVDTSGARVTTQWLSVAKEMIDNYASGTGYLDSI